MSLVSSNHSELMYTGHVHVKSQPVSSSKISFPCFDLVLKCHLQSLAEFESYVDVITQCHLHEAICCSVFVEAIFFFSLVCVTKSLVLCHEQTRVLEQTKTTKRCITIEKQY